jgi:Protein of unknown function with PCYCGC motif
MMIRLPNHKRSSSVVLLLGLALLLPTLSLTVVSHVARSEPSTQSTDQDTPAYHETPPNPPLPTLMNPLDFESPVVQNAYRLVERLVPILYQQPCYCRCDRHHGHSSLLDCYLTKHTAGCGTCLQELFYVYEQRCNAKTAVEIRQGIIRGEWKTLDIKKYDRPWMSPDQDVPLPNPVAQPSGRSHSR